MEDEKAKPLPETVRVRVCVRRCQAAERARVTCQNRGPETAQTTGTKRTCTRPGEERHASHGKSCVAEPPGGELARPPGRPYVRSTQLQGPKGDTLVSP